MSHRMHGEFRCSNCDNIWTSAHAWPGMGQMCTKCKQKRPLVMPFRLTELKNKNQKFYKSDSKIEHPQDKCQKCKTLGRSCML